MRTMYDAVTARNILNHDRTPALVAGYIDRIKLAPWSAGDWALFPNARKVTIVKKASTRDGHVLDVEPGDATPEQAPGWAAQRRRDGFAHPVIYCNRSTWPKVKAAFAAQGVAPPLYWIATASGRPEIPDGAIAAQYLLDYQGVDVSVVADYWPGVDGPATEGESDMDKNQDQLHREMHVELTGAAAPIYPPQSYVPLRKIVERIDGNVAALSGAVDGLGKVLAAVTQNPAITPEFVEKTVRDAVAQSITIAGDVHIGPAVAAEVAEPTQ
jgi:hypothetical protein